MRRALLACTALLLTTVAVLPAASAAAPDLCDGWDIQHPEPPTDPSPPPDSALVRVCADTEEGVVAFAPARYQAYCSPDGPTAGPVTVHNCIGAVVVTYSL